MNGFVKIITEKAYGFIRGEDGKEYFFHRSDFSGHWDDLVVDFSNNMKPEVTFDIVQSPKGPRAGNVSRIVEPRTAKGSLD